MCSGRQQFISSSSKLSLALSGLIHWNGRKVHKSNFTSLQNAETLDYENNINEPKEQKDGSCAKKRQLLLATK